MPRSTSKPTPPAFELPGIDTLRKAFEGLAPLSELRIDPEAWARAQQHYVQNASALWNEALTQHLSPPSDRRFAHPAWQDSGSGFLAQLYLLNSRALTELAESVQAEPKTRARIRFAVQQMVDASAPSNFLALNPEAQKKALDTQGESLAKGLQLLWADVQRGKLSQTDDSAFQVGRNVATTPGSVVFENDYFQLLEYAPLTKEVHERPFLMVPPSINKYYILDLQPENSLIRYAIENGHRTFVVSWRNPDERCAHWTWDEVIEGAPIEALRVVREITGAEQVNALGFCVGGTILATALAVLAARGQRPVASLTLLTTLLDFANTGVLDIFVDENLVKARELTLGDPAKPGLLKGAELAQTFSFLRPNDLVWNYVVGNYLKGEMPPAFDLLYWNGDSTNMAGPMYCWYLRHTYLQNELKQPGKLTVCGEKVDLGRISVPTYVYGSREDHIVPWEAAYASTQLLRGPVRFVLGASGHIAGVINPASKNKRSHWLGPENHPADPQAWLQKATETPGSWWRDWAAWLGRHGGGVKPAPKAPGSRKYRPIEPAPGRYVQQKA
ncbi:MAG: class I poly(R)-hydroxyalkanoic acid synthase [Inhella sp.]|jgi:polyhydroxyalkanoate synthase|uniref:class I poly(R)-hydroxyalkanoic acid synthase n=1 Tax=Inhella sp. TaxID=1921806 RepID=UPI0022BD436B|nr:class I poly(R)-hydroxyalkanoic acid synthase [Inhella sp.]MCZ8235154.1 class I poly(R)-hydroxyalkanoic acid synthase [Inhella sp.]